MSSAFLIAFSSIETEFLRSSTPLTIVFAPEDILSTASVAAALASSRVLRASEPRAVASSMLSTALSRLSRAPVTASQTPPKLSDMFASLPAASVATPERRLTSDTASSASFPASFVSFCTEFFVLETVPFTLDSSLSILSEPSDASLIALSTRFESSSSCVFSFEMLSSERFRVTFGSNCPTMPPVSFRPSTFPAFTQFAAYPVSLPAIPPTLYPMWL